MKLTIPVLALVVALLLVASQSLYTVDQRQYAIRFQLGEIIETQANAGLYAKIPLMQNIKFYDKRTLLLDQSSWLPLHCMSNQAQTVPSKSLTSDRRSRCG